MAQQQESSHAVRYVRGEDSFRIAAESTPDQVHRWAEDWFKLWTLEVCHADKSQRRVERFIDCCSRLAAVAELQKLKPAPLLRFIQELGGAWVSGRIPSRSDSHFAKAQQVVERVDSWARGQSISREAAKLAPDEQPTSQTPAKGKQKATINARMIDILQKRPEAKDWTVEQWMQCLGCKSKASVARTKCWEAIMGARAVRKVQRLQRDKK
jgi:hypothetical protein